MSSAILILLIVVVGHGLGFTVGVATRRYGPSLVGCALAMAVLYLLYIVSVGEDPPFVPYVMVAAAVGGSASYCAFAVGVGLPRAFERVQHT